MGIGSAPAPPQEFCHRVLDPSTRAHDICKLCESPARTHDFCDFCASPARTYEFCESLARTHDSIVPLTF